MRPAIALLCLALASPAVSAQSVAPVPVAADATVIHVQASGTASAVPDLALIIAGVVTQHSDSAQALSDNAARMQQVMAALRAAGVASRDIQTGHLGLAPQYRYADNQPPVLTGYQASNSVRITLRDLAAMGKVIDALARQGANQIDGPHFSLQDTAALLRQARLAALDDARAQADLYARSLGLKVRRVLLISDNGYSAPAPMVKMARMASMEMADTPVAAGQSEIQVQLSVSYELGH